MKKFIKQSLIFLLLFVSIVVLGVFIIPYPKIQQSLLGGIEQKHVLLKKAKSPKIIFVGGSNVSFSLDSEKIKKHFDRDVINMGLHHRIGLKYMINDILPYLEENDLVIISPEYTHFFGKFSDGKFELLSILVDIHDGNWNKISLPQKMNLISLFPKYSLIKFKEFIKYCISKNYRKNIKIVDEYHKDSFNEFGDVQMHWLKKKKEFEPFGKIQGELNLQLLDFLNASQNKISTKGADVLIIYPCLQKSAYNNQMENIIQVKNLLNESQMKVGGEPEDFVFDDSLFFDSSYHLRYTGVQARTDKIISIIENYEPFHTYLNEDK